MVDAHPIDLHDKEILARTIFAEARNQGPRGMLAVGCVIMNRLKTGHWGDSVSKVCQARNQFSCWRKSDPNYAIIGRGGKIATYALESPIEKEQLELCRKIAARLLSGHYKDVTNSATYYYSVHINAPNWAKHHVGPVQKIRDHLFMKLETHHRHQNTARLSAQNRQHDQKTGRKVEFHTAPHTKGRAAHHSTDHPTHHVAAHHPGHHRQHHTHNNSL